MVQGGRNWEVNLLRGSISASVTLLALVQLISELLVCVTLFEQQLLL